MNTGILMLMVLVFFGFMLWTTYSQQRKAKRAAAELQRLLKKGDEILTIGGLFGTVRKLGDDFVIIEIESGATARVLRRAIREIVSEEIDDVYGDDEDEQTDDEYDEVDEEYDDEYDESEDDDYDESDDESDDDSEAAGDVVDESDDDAVAAGEEPEAPGEPEAPTPPVKAD